jgi:hypothetical protein
LQAAARQEVAGGLACTADAKAMHVNSS